MGKLERKKRRGGKLRDRVRREIGLKVRVKIVERKGLGLREREK